MAVEYAGIQYERAEVSCKMEYIGVVFEAGKLDQHQITLKLTRLSRDMWGDGMLRKVHLEEERYFYWDREHFDIRVFMEEDDA